jgi:hypothetical protein
MRHRQPRWRIPRSRAGSILCDIIHDRAYAWLCLGNDGQAIDELKKAARVDDQDAQNVLQGQKINW